MNKHDLLHRGWAIAFALAMALGLAACAPQADEATSSTAGAESATATSEQSSTAQDEGALYGSTWVASIVTGNLPDAAPQATDDLYLHYAYDYAAQHQDDSFASVIDEARGQLQDAVTATIEDDAVKSPELEQLRIFYDQAADMDAIQAAGAEELKPYLKAVANTKSLAELESLLLSDDFPFSPWIETTISAPDMKSTICVAVMPHMLFSNEETGSQLYQDSDNEQAQAAYEALRSQALSLVCADLSLLSLADDPEQALPSATRMFELEQRYGKDDDPFQYLHAEYGAQTQAIKALTIDELEAACPNFPMRETLAKLGEATGDVIVMYPAWLASFNEVWTEDNFELLRDMTEVKVLRECADFIDPELYAWARSATGQPEPTADQFAYTACDKKETFAQLLAKTYVEQTLGEETVEQLEQLANDLIDSYIELVGETEWLNAESRESIIDKIDNMALNILYPDGGYFDYGELELTRTEDGGTLLGNYLSLKAYNDKLEAQLVGQPARASATWLYMRPTAQNCFYDAVSNSINIFPGYVTSASYTPGMSPEELLAGMGFVVGHEMSHAFDYTGSQFNAFGQPTAVFADTDVEEFVAKQHAIADYYSTIEFAPGVKVDGTATSTEATADLCGMQVVLKRAQALEGFDYEKMFGHIASSWATVYSPAFANLLSIDIHPPNNVRVNTSAQMFDEYYDAFGATEGNAMYLAPDERLELWGKGSA